MSSRWLAVAGLICNAAVWGLSWIAFRSLGADGIHPLWSTAIIYGLGGVAIAAVRPTALRELAGQPGLAWIALASGMTNACFNTAVATGDVVRVVLLFYLMPVWAIVLARVILREAITGSSLARMALGLVGALLVLYQPGLGVPWPRDLADWAGLVGGMFFALNNILLKARSESSETARALSMFVGALVLCTLTGSGLHWAGAIAWPTMSIPSAITLATWSTLFLVANLGLQVGAARLPASLTSVIMLTEVLVAAVSSWWAGVTALRPQDLIGGALILAAPWIAQWHRQGKPRKSVA